MAKILGQPHASAYQMSTYLLTNNPSPKFSKNIYAIEVCQMFLDVCAKEGVRGDIAFAQACKETGYFKFTGDVKYTQNNFAGLGATGNGECGCIFKDIETGILAQAQHLKTYATKAALNCINVDPRRTEWFVNTKGGTAPNVEDLAGTWAVPGYSTSKYASLQAANLAKNSYGYNILDILEAILKIPDKEETKYYRVQCGAFSKKANAENLSTQLKAAGFSVVIKQIDNLYKCQVGAFSNKVNAEAYLTTVKSKGFDGFLVYN